MTRKTRASSSYVGDVLLLRKLELLDWTELLPLTPKRNGGAGRKFVIHQLAERTVQPFINQEISLSQS